jgi:hypothetical protein
VITYKLSTSFFLSLMLLVLAQCWSPADAKDKSKNKDKEVKHYIRVPVFFVTDRRREAHDKGEGYVNFGTTRQYLGKCGHDPYLGVSYAVIENTHNKPIDGLRKELGWQNVSKHHEGTYSVALICGCTYETAKDRWSEALYKDAMLTPDKEVFIFAPGYMSTFESGIREAARFAYYSERPVVLYSWPSKGKFRGYTADEASIEWSQEHFNDMLHEIIDLGNRSPGIKARLLAHSMGSRLILRAVPIIKGQDVFNEISVVCPDVDDGLVKHYVTTCVTAQGKATVRLYMSRKDKMLALSQLVHGGYKRLGEDHAGLMPTVLKSPYQPASEVCEIELSEATKKRFQTIDFTNMDRGTLGHKIPVHLICSMSQTGQPPEGVELKFQTGGAEDEATKLMHKVAHIGAEEKAAETGYYEVFGPKLRLGSKLPKLNFFAKDWTLKD